MDIEFGMCDFCKKQTHIKRRYYHYDVKCDCCNRKEDNHFEIVYHCEECNPKPPRRITVILESLEKYK